MLIGYLRPAGSASFARALMRHSITSPWQGHAHAHAQAQALRNSCLKNGVGGNAATMAATSSGLA